MVKLAEAAEEFLFICTSVTAATTTICWGSLVLGFTQVRNLWYSTIVSDTLVGSFGISDMW